ncbi:MAG: hypothetical protein IPK33_11025 [Gemmatimonadetes bacterium]|nr:hypothetical protein [Gemmatimonadota bacterium]
MKSTLASHGVPTASYAIVHSLTQLAPYARRAFPFAVRRDRGVSSCFCHTHRPRLRRVGVDRRELLGASSEPILIERFLPGESFVCGILGNGDSAVMLPALGVSNDPFAPSVTASTAIPLSADGLAEEVEAIALRAFHARGCRDVARVDIRLSDTGVPNVCAVDPIPALAVAGDGGLLTAARAAGLADEELVQRCLLLAAERVGLAIPSAPLLARLARRTPASGARIRRVAS